MHNNFETLQQKCKKYHLKNSLKLIVPIILTTLALLSLYFFIKTDTFTQTEVSTIVKSTQEVQEPKEKVVVTPKKVSISTPKAMVSSTKIPTSTPKQVDTQKVKNTKKDLQYSLELDYNYSPKPIKQVKTKKKEVKTHKEVVYIHKNSKKESTQSKSFQVSLKKVDSIDKMLTLYDKNANYALALRIATYYYDNKNYTQALLWSKKANILNKRDDGSWIIYAKSEYAKGNRKRAIEILSLFLGNSKSSDASVLLLSWTKGS